jgi:nitroreductase
MSRRCFINGWSGISNRCTGLFIQPELTEVIDSRLRQTAHSPTVTTHFIKRRFFMINVLRKRRSIRKYTEQRIDKRSFNLLLETLLRAPSSRNLKPCEFIVVDDRELLGKLSNARESGSQFLKGAALGIVICADGAKSDVWIEDGSIASILVYMVAQSLGLGSCWIQVRNRMHSGTESAETYIQGLLGLPGHLKVLSVISIGHPDEKKKPVAKAELDYRRIRFNRYSEYAIPSKK